MTTCPTCGEHVDDGTAFCEGCGAQLGSVTQAEAVVAATARAVAGGEVHEQAAPISTPTRTPTRTPPGPPPAGGADVGAGRACLSCGGVVGPDGFCQTCGTKQPRERDHYREAPVAWVAGVCDRGLLHGKNEDALAVLATDAPAPRAVLVVLDGVSSSLDSDVGSLAGARAAREVLRTPMPAGMGTPDSRAAAVVATFAAAVTAANAAIVATTAADSASPASATFVCAVVEGAWLGVANVGDSRVYWVPDAGDAETLTVDDSAAEELIAAGMDRQMAENGPQGHAITRWLGRDARDIAPRVAQRVLTEPGWVLVCSDGLWNYASEPAAIKAQVVAAGVRTAPELALALVGFANACGGRDNITVALARFDPAPTAAPTAAPTERPSDG